MFFITTFKNDVREMLLVGLKNESESEEKLVEYTNLGNTSNGVSEEILGLALKDYANRDEVVIATKYMGNGLVFKLPLPGCCERIK